MEMGNNLAENIQTRSTLNGSVERVAYFNQETGQSILEIKENALNKNIFISGQLPMAYPGMQITGVLQDKESKNDLWRVQNLKLSTPKGEKNLRRFLKSEAFADIGPKLARLLASSFPENFFSILENSPEELLTVSGIGGKKKNKIIESWEDYKVKTKFKNFLFEERLPLSWFQILWPFHREKSLDFLKTQPYSAGRQYHLPFEIIDHFALKYGASLESSERLRFGLTTVLWNFYNHGHCGYPEDRVFSEAAKLLEVSMDQLEEILEIEILEEEIVTESIRGVNCLYFKKIWELEQAVAKKLFAFQQKDSPFGWFNSEKVLTWAQNILNIQLAPLQKSAIETALTSPLTVITGGPGTGKTTLIRSLTTILQTQHIQFALCTPTGRAAQRLGEATGMPAQTIHRLLKYDGSLEKFIYNKENLLKYDLVLVDEASMVDISLMAHLLDALPAHCALILVGDADQLPSVGAGNILHSIISSSKFKIVRLQEIYRQSEHSLIKKNAQKINQSELPSPYEKGEFQYIPVNNANHAKQVVQNLLENIIPQRCGIKTMQELQILVPMNQGMLGTQTLNEEIQKTRNEKSINSSGLIMIDFGQDFKVGDKVMVLKNDYKKDVFNGDIGYIEKINYEDQYVEVIFSERPVRFVFSELDRLTLAYAISIHKSQGSEYSAVIVILTSEHLPLAQRHMLYTAVTRGRDFVFLVAEPMALQKALQQVESRWEKLTELLTGPSLERNQLSAFSGEDDLDGPAADLAVFDVGLRAFDRHI